MAIDRRYSVAEGQAVKAPAAAATTANITLAGEQTIDGVAVAQTSPPTRVLVKNQSTASENGIYDVSTGNWTRSRDFDGASDVVTGTRVFVVGGSTYALFEFAVSTAGDITIDTTSIAFTALGQTSAAASAVAAAASAASAAASAAAALGQIWTTGDVKLTLKNVADSGWRLFDDGSIGDGSSGATYANVAALALFTLMYDNFADADCAIQTSVGGATTRAAQTNAATAWAAHCRIFLPKTLGRTLAIAGAGSGLTSRALGHVVGEETHVLAQAELPNVTLSTSIASGQGPHLHTAVVSSGNTTGIAGGGGNSTAPGDTGLATLPAMTGTTPTGGSDTPHNNMQPTSFLNAMVKL